MDFLLVFQNKKLLDIQLIVKFLSPTSKRTGKHVWLDRKEINQECVFFSLENHFRDFKIEIVDFSLKQTQTGNLLWNEIQLAP